MTKKVRDLETKQHYSWSSKGGKITWLIMLQWKMSKICLALRAARHKDNLHNLNESLKVEHWLIVDVFLSFYWLIIWHIKLPILQNPDTFLGSHSHQFALLADFRYICWPLWSCHEWGEPACRLLLGKIIFPCISPLYPGLYIVQCNK